MAEWPTGSQTQFNKDTFHSDVRVSSVYMHDTEMGNKLSGRAKLVGCFRPSYHVRPSEGPLAMASPTSP